MKKNTVTTKPPGFSEYISTCPEECRDLMHVMWQTISKVVPDATETISYGIPTFQYKGKNLVHFSGYKQHIGFYPGAVAIEAFELKLRYYQTSKGTVQFPLDRKLPAALIREMVRFCVRKADEQSKGKPPVKSKTGFLPMISAPARRALESKGIKTVRKLSSFSEKELLSLHGIGPTAIPVLKQALKEAGLEFKKTK
jgi:uncharacterized protein YdhG (YjbR/CyaY superfamily)